MSASLDSRRPPAELFRGRVVDVARKSLIVELSGPERKIEAFIDLVRPYGIGELARTGLIAMKPGQQAGGSEA